MGSVVALGHPPREMVCPYAPYTRTDNTDNKEDHENDAGDEGNFDDEYDKLLNAIFHQIFDPSGRTGEWMLLGNNHDLGSTDPDMLEQILDGHVYAHYGYLSTPEQLQQVIWPVGDEDEDESEAEGKVEGECEDEGSVDGEIEAQYERYKSNELPACIERRFFGMEDGRFGLCPWTTKEGDVVVVLMGGNVPYLLRAFGEERYLLVGECFVQGAMKGEVVRDEMRESEVFVLK